MALRVFLEKEIGQDCASLDDGAKVFELILPELLKGFPIELDFKGVNLILTPFLNACFGKLLKRFDKKIIMTHVIMRNVSDEFLQRINRFVDRKDDEFNKTSEREILQELYDEDGLTDTSL